MPVVGQAFNLVQQTGLDIDRRLADERAALAAECSAKEFAARMLKRLAECPGFVAADAPVSERAMGRVVVDPGHALDARQWLKRRFQVAENVELSPDTGIAFDIKPRSRGVVGKRQKFTGRKAEQFQFEL